MRAICRSSSEERDLLMSFRISIRAIASAAVLLVGGCTDESPPPETDQEDPPLAVAPVDTAEPEVTPAELREEFRVNANAKFLQSGGRIRIVDLMYQSHVSDLSPLKGLPLRILDLTGTA